MPSASLPPWPDTAFRCCWSFSTTRSYGWIRWYRRIAFGRGWEEPDLPETRFVDVASAYGFRAVRVEDPADLAEVFGGGIDGPTLVEVVTSVWETPIEGHRRALEQNEQADY